MICSIRILSRLRLPIKYIIIENDAEIGEFIGHLRRAEGKPTILRAVARSAFAVLYK
jgi:hypothetical protein